jgi:hypothetical protein
VIKKRFWTFAALLAIATAMPMTLAGQEPYVRPKTIEEMIAYARQNAGVPDDFKPMRLSLSKSLFGSDDLLRGRLFPPALARFSSAVRPVQLRSATEEYRGWGKASVSGLKMP